MTIANGITSTRGRGRVSSEADVSPLQVLRWGGLGIGTWILTALLIYATVVPFVVNLVEIVQGRGLGRSVPIALLTSVFAIVLAAYLIPRGWRYLRASRDAYMQQELMGEFRPRLAELQYSLHSIRKSTLTMAGLIIVVGYVIIAIVGPFVAPFPYNPSFYEKHVPPGQGALDEEVAAPRAVATTTWVNASDALAKDTNYARSTALGDTLILTGFRPPFVFSSGTVRSVDVGVLYYSPEEHSASVALSWDEGAHWTPEQTLPFKSSPAQELWYLSFANDHAWTHQELNGSHTWVRLTHIQANGASAVGTMLVDYVEMRADFVGPIHPWGTNELGEDLLAGILDGTGTDIRIGVLVVFGAVAIGVVLGVFSGYLGRGVDEVVMRITDMFLAVPGLILAIAFTATLGRSLDNVLIALMLVSWPGYTRLVRGQVLSVREISYVEAARAVGAPTRRIVLRHILPNVLSVVIVAATLDLGTIVIGTAALSFLGLGAQEYEPEWGIMITLGYRYMVSGFWWEYIPPGIAILLFVLAFNLFGDGLRDILDPRLRR